MVLGTGCCDSTAPFLYDRNYFAGADAVEVGRVAGVPVFAHEWLARLYGEDGELVVDVDENVVADSFSLETEHGRRFTLRIPTRQPDIAGNPHPAAGGAQTDPPPEAARPPPPPEDFVADGSSRQITLLICDDHKLLTESLAMVIEAEPDLDMVDPPVDDPSVAVDLVRAHHP